MGRVYSSPVISSGNNTLALSPEAYGEIEKFLLDGRYDFVFEAGPGSRIDLQAIGVRYLMRDDLK